MSFSEAWAEKLVGAELAGRYRLDAILGRGSYAVVFRGKHTWTERPVAVKVLGPHLAPYDPTLVKRFLREAKAAAALRHPHVVDVLDMGEAEHTAFLVLELLEGETLAARLAREGALEVELALRILLPLCDALHAAHALSMIHRDVKAENVFLHEEGGRTVPKLLDFGIVRTAYADGETPLTRRGTLLGTPHYMAPEQVVGRPPTIAVDVWSCGVLAYRMIAGRFPYDAPHPTEVLADIVTKPHPPLATVAPHAPRGVAAAVERALAKDPSARFADVHAFVDALVGGAREVGIELPDPRRRRGE
ncbi:MAG TPA: serine/threonine-protein kinase [Sandaracinaceae bacterium]